MWRSYGEPPRLIASLDRYSRRSLVNRMTLQLALKRLRLRFKLRPPIAKRLERNAVKLAILALVQLTKLSPPRDARARTLRHSVRGTVAHPPSVPSSYLQIEAGTDRVHAIQTSVQEMDAWPPEQSPYIPFRESSFDNSRRREN